MLHITDKAKKKLLKLMQESNKTIKIFIKHGGCSGFKFHLQYTNTQNEYDEVIYLNNEPQATPNEQNKLKNSYKDLESQKTTNCNSKNKTHTTTNHHQDSLINSKYKIYIDATAIMHIIGTTMDYETSMFKSGFIFINKNNQTCGCGQSFAL
ncbi:MAG: iron-sulfur cluster biosynthesis family protein [Pseudomonadota bacterium]